MTKIVTAGRTDLFDFFRLSGIRSDKELNHTPILAFLVTGKEIKVEIVENAEILLDSYQDHVQCMKQWTGKWDSDFFQFTVGDLRKHCEKYPKESYQLV
jgi:hypothetical protein